jgi:glycosyltransferase involved in cell wall biosynthesis
LTQTILVIIISGSMHIGLNAHLLSLSRGYRAAGINWYIYNLLRHLPNVGNQHRYTAFLGDKKAKQAFPELETKMTFLPTANPAVRIFWEQTVQPVQLLKEGIDLLHSLAFVQPMFLSCPGIITIYDLSFILFPERFHPLKRLYLRWGTHYSARRAQRIIAISASTKRDITQLLGIADKKVDVIPCGVDEDFQPLGNQQALGDFRRKRHLPERIILFVGTIEPRKNLTALLKGYALLKKRIHPPRLVVAGAKGWHHEKVLSAVEELDLRADVIFPGYIPQEELPLWYNAAELFIYPSLYEGFGLPPLEAMACGTPVITSNTSSLPEVVGEAGILVNPDSVEEIGEAMQRLLTDNSLRAEMKRKGLDRAREFSWQEAARGTVKVYEQAVTNSRA